MSAILSAADREKIVEWLTGLYFPAEPVRLLAASDAANAARVEELEAALRRIADMDYRGNRPAASAIAYEALHVKASK